MSKSLEHALAVLTHPRWREFDKSTIEAARQIVSNAMAVQS